MKTAETNDIRPLTADETLVVSGGQVAQIVNSIGQAEKDAAIVGALIEGVVNVFKSVLPR